MSEQLGPGGILPGLTPGSRVASYLLEEQVGVGAMAVVFRAADQRLARRVALKVLVPALAADQGFRQRFIRESRAAAAVEDPHIIPVYEAGEAGDLLFIAMRYVPGGDARTLLHREGLLPGARAAAIIAAAASALDAAHRAGLVHRDVKPGNMLIDAQPGRPDQVYLSDFGLSKGALVGLTRAGQFVGTPNYMSPEQIEGRPVDGRTDQYALACTAFELLTGVAPFQRDDGMAVIWAHMSQPPPPLAPRRPDLPPAADQVLARALAKAPEHRYPSCAEFAAALRAVLGADPRQPVLAPGHPATWPAAMAAGPALAPPGPALAPPGPALAPPGPAVAPAGWGPAPATPAPSHAPPGYQAPVYPAAPPNGPPSMRPAGPPMRPPRRPSPLQLALAVAALLVVAGVILAAVLLSSPGPGTAGPARSSTPAVRPSSHPARPHPARPHPARTRPVRPRPVRPRARPKPPATEFTVCVDPVDSCGLAQMQTKPSTVLLSGDGSGLMKSVRWSGWGSPVATGVGTYELDNCVPSCAQGKYRPSPATITLSGLTPYAGGKRAYADMVINAPKAVGTSRYRHLVP